MIHDTCQYEHYVFALVCFRVRLFVFLSVIIGLLNKLRTNYRDISESRPWNKKQAIRFWVSSNARRPRPRIFVHFER